MKTVDDFLKEHGDAGEERSKFNLDPEKLSERQKLLNRCRERCLYLIEEAEKTEARLREKLRKSGKYPEDIIDETMEFLKKYDYLNDERFARRMISQYEKTKSLKEIEQKLFQRNVSKEAIRQVMAEYKEDGNRAQDAEMEAVRKLIRKKCRNLEELDRDAKKKLYASLMRKGFSYTMVAKALALEWDE